MATTPEAQATAARCNLRLYRGDDRGIQMMLKDSSGAPIALPASTWTSQIKDKIGGTLLASFTVDATQAASGIITLGIAHADSAALPSRCVYDLQVNDAGSITTYMQGTISMEGEVTQP